ncbi:MAG: tetratricopeptide repeat protein [Flavobacteriales bacterium]
MRTALCLTLPLALGLHAMAQRTAQDELSDALAAARDGRLDSASARVERALVLDPALAPAYKLRGDLHQRRQEWDPALADYERAEDMGLKDARLYVSRSALRITNGNYKAALRDADKAVALDPTDADAWYNRGCALYLGGDLDGAIKDATKALRLAPQHADALYLSGVVKGEQYREEDGLDDINAALQLKPGIPGGLMSKGVLLYETKRYQEAIATFGQVIDTDTTELAAVYYYRADSYYHLDQKEQACADWLKSARLGDKDAAFIKKNYCDTDATKIPKKPKRGKRKSMIQF